MKTWTWWMAGALVVLPAAVDADDAKKAPSAKAAPTAKAEMVNPRDLKWGAAPPDLPAGAQLAVLHGDPTKPGIFTVRLKVPKNYKIAPHWHSKDEQLTVIKGTLVLHMGDKMNVDVHELEEGAYHFLPGKMHHAAESKGETIVQINGTGPFDIHYLVASDNPNPKSASR